MAAAPDETSSTCFHRPAGQSMPIKDEPTGGRISFLWCSFLQQQGPDGVLLPRLMSYK